jgi:hypothetical protein
MSDGQEVSAVIHVHTRWSDGSGTVDEVLQAAHTAGVEVLWLTDHDTLAARQNPGNGWYGSTLLLTGTEMTPPQNHLLALGVTRVPDREGPWAGAVADVLEQGGVAIVAHPDDPGNPFLRLPSYRWTERDVLSISGLEIWNHLSQWMRDIRSIRQGIRAVRDPWHGASSPDPRTLALWDRLGQVRPLVGIAGTDAHAVRVGHRRLGMTVMPYAVVFRTLRTHLLTHQPLSGDVRRDEALLVEALRRRRALVVSLRAGDVRGFRFWAETGSRRVDMGDEVEWLPPMTFQIVSPVPADLRLLRDGVPVAAVHSASLSAPATGPGVWRVEAWRRQGRGLSVPWILTNPIYVRQPGDYSTPPAS